ncbi:fimbrial protein [Serratia rubidaea]|uniref:fimbrial protein n=1 Tax=Serratia rubidaea TaxID=61652 RepID=UPI0013791BC3|nr:fimbrial protein [Serratia rubidaea]QPR63425.1 fimbrial protein [Serratia rubidaea]HAY0635427.1 fimbrial protein [Serratia rubidaea]
MKWTLLLIPLLFWLPAHAELDNTCWGDPVNIAVVDIAAAPFTRNTKGAEAIMKYRMNPIEFSGICNRSVNYMSMTHYVDMGPTLVPSEMNAGYFKLTDDVDVRIGSGSPIKYFPLVPSDGLIGLKSPSSYGENIKVSGFSVAGSGIVEIKLRRDIIGGAIVVPSDTELFSAYRVMDWLPPPPRPSRPIVQARTKGGGQVIAITPECSINQGNVIEANFHTLQTDQVVSRSDGERYSKDIALRFSCNSSLTQDIKVQLVADSAGFSSDLIRSDNSALGFALKHHGQLVKPMTSFPARLDAGTGNATVTLTPVKDPDVALTAGAFNASATLVITSL